MNKKSALLIILCALILSPFIFAIGEDKDYSGALSKREGLAAHQAVDDFLDLSVKYQVSRIEIYYSSWTAKHWRPTFFEDELINKQRDLKVIEYAPQIAFQVHFLRNLERILREFKFTRIQPDTRDFRLGCLFYSGDKEVLRIFFSTDDPAMFINGISYKIDLELIRLFFSLLPPQARDEIDRAMLQYWVRSGTSLQE
jgi:hypothetical protein